MSRLLNWICLDQHGLSWAEFRTLSQSDYRRLVADSDRRFWKVLLVAFATGIAVLAAGGIVASFVSML